MCWSGRILCPLQSWQVADPLFPHSTWQGYLEVNNFCITSITTFPASPVVSGLWSTFWEKPPKNFPHDWTQQPVSSSLKLSRKPRLRNLCSPSLTPPWPSSGQAWEPETSSEKWVRKCRILGRGILYDGFTSRSPPAWLERFPESLQRVFALWRLTLANQIQNLKRKKVQTFHLQKCSPHQNKYAKSLWAPKCSYWKAEHRLMAIIAEWFGWKGP